MTGKLEKAYVEKCGRTWFPLKKRMICFHIDPPIAAGNPEGPYNNLLGGVSALKISDLTGPILF